MGGGLQTEIIVLVEVVDKETIFVDVGQENEEENEVERAESSFIRYRITTFSSLLYYSSVIAGIIFLFRFLIIRYRTIKN
jgi:hypothetical protein